MLEEDIVPLLVPELVAGLYRVRMQREVITTEAVTHAVLLPHDSDEIAVVTDIETGRVITVITGER